MKTRISTLGDVGDLSAPPGSQAWAIAVRLHVQKKLKDRHDSENLLREWCEMLREREGWRALLDRRGRTFTSWEAFCKHPKPEGLGEPAAELESEIERRTLRAKPGRPNKDEKVDGQPFHNKGTAYYLARLDRDRPELAARVRAGELKAKTAAREAGIIKIRTPLEQLQNMWAKLTHDDRLTFLRWARTP
jgi:hypothetical protein